MVARLSPACLKLIVWSPSTPPFLDGTVLQSSLSASEYHSIHTHRTDLRTDLISGFCLTNTITNSAHSKTSFEIGTDAHQANLNCGAVRLTRPARLDDETQWSNTKRYVLKIGVRVEMCDPLWNLSSAPTSAHQELHISSFPIFQMIIQTCAVGETIWWWMLSAYVVFMCSGSIACCAQGTRLKSSHYKRPVAILQLARSTKDVTDSIKQSLKRHQGWQRRISSFGTFQNVHTEKWKNNHSFMNFS